MKNIIGMTLGVLTAANLTTAVIPATSVFADTTTQNTAKLTTTTDFGGLDPNNPVLDSSSTSHYISGVAVLNYIKENDYSAYQKLSDSDKQAVISMDELRQGSTYVRSYSNGHTRLYINSALVKVVKLAGAVAIAGAVASAIASAGITGAPAAMIATGVGGAISLIPADRGAWFEFNSRWNIVNFGSQ